MFSERFKRPVTTEVLRRCKRGDRECVGNVCCKNDKKLRGELAARVILYRSIEIIGKNPFKPPKTNSFGKGWC